MRRNSLVAQALATVVATLPVHVWAAEAADPILFGAFVEHLSRCVVSAMVPQRW